MGVSKKDEEVLFTECKESVEDVFGWKIIIFLPQNTFWKIFIMMTVFISFIITTIKVFYWKTNNIFYALEVLCDTIYFLDILCASLHFGLVKTRKLRHGERRPFFFLLIDIISAIPLNLLFEYLIYKEGEKPDKLHYILRANVLLRTYQLLKGFTDIKKTVSRIKSYYFLTFIEVFTYFALITHFFSCFINNYGDENFRKKCLQDFTLCIIENDFLTFGLLDHNFFAPFSGFPLQEYRLLLIVEFLIGFIFTYGFVIPLIIYINLAFLKEFFEYSYKRKQLRLLIENTIQEKVLKQKLTNYFHYAWTYGKGDNMPEIINLFPLGFKKTIFCDIHWEALKHSEFLRGLSQGCKRSLSLHMTTEFMLPNTVLFKKQTIKTYFMYLESGLIQVMAEENNESPVLNLSDGTVLGEISFFFQTGSKALLRTGKFSVIHILKCTDLFRVLWHYPKDMKKMYHKMKLRLKVARAVNRNKTEICPLFLHEQSYAVKNQDNVKWLKRQFRALIKLEKESEINTEDLLVKQKETDAKYQRQVHPLETQLEHTSLNLSLLCINDEGEKVHDLVCLKMSFPWFFDPRSQFITLWSSLNNALALIVVILYPAFLGWFSVIPAWFYNVAIVINFIYILDVLVQFITAVKVKDAVIANFSAVVSQRFTNLGFYLDVMAALPLYLLAHLYRSLQAPFKLNLLLSNTLLKSYKLLPVMNKLSYSPKRGIYYRATIKYILIIYFSIYWSAAIFNLIGVECIFYECGERDWYPKNYVRRGENYKFIVSVFVSVYMVLDIPNKSIHTDETPSFIFYFVMYIISNFLYYAWQGECVACYVLEHSHELEYRNLIEDVHDFMLQKGVAEMIKKRVMGTLEFQWLYDKGNYLTQKRRILEDLSSDLRDEVDRKFLLPIIQKSKLFKWEDEEEFFADLCRRANRLAVPANSLLMTFGIKAFSLYIIHKGYVQVNSFIVGDSHLDISTPLIFKSGDTFPVLVAFSQIPSSITAITLTDCELLILDLESILTTLMTYKVLPDIVQALKEIDLTPMSSAKLGVSRIKTHLKYDKAAYAAPFAHLKYLGMLLKYIFIKKGIDSESKKYLCWEIVRTLLILFNLIMWPLVFGCCCQWAHKLVLIYILLALDGVSSLVDFYLRLHIGYYNDLGIYMGHPLYTLLRYLSSSFLLDFIAFAPNFHMIYLLKKNRLNFNLTIISIHLAMRSLSSYRIIGLFNYTTYDFKKFLNLMKLIKCLFFGLFALHYYINFMAYLYLQGKRKPELSFTPQKKLEPEKPLEYYFYEFSLITSILLQGQVFFDSYSSYNLVRIIILGTLAVLYQTFIFSVLALSTTSSRKNFIVYQYYLRSFVKYMNEEKVKDHISNQAIKHFEFKWRKYRGRDMKKIFSSFPYTLHEDIMCPLYKDTFSGVRSLSRSNEAFYRILSRNVQVVTLMSASVIIYHNQVQEDVFFVHKGKCTVEGVPKILIKGAIIGDIRYRGLMQHTIKALTNVDLLRISSKLFFVIMGNFHGTKKAFQLEAAAAEDYLESLYVDPREDTGTEMESLTKEEDFSEAKFMVMNDFLEGARTSPFKTKNKTLFNPDSLTMRVLDFIFFLDAYITFMLVPLFIGTTLLTWWALSIIYFLDAVWIFKIILTTRTTLLDSKTGNYTYQRKVIILSYLRKLDGMVLHVLSVLPIEVIVAIHYGKSLSYQDCHIMYYCYSNRLLRVPHIHYYISSKMKALLVNVYLKLLNISVFGLAVINLFVSLNLVLRRGKDFDEVECHWGAQKSQLDDIVKSYFLVLNCYVGAGILVGLPETPLEVLFLVSIEVLSLLSKAVIVSQVLVLIYVTNFAKLDQLLKLQQLEKYLAIRDVSPALFQKMQKYSCNLLNAYKEEAHPSFLINAPPFIKMKIMEDLYLHDLSECYIFQGIASIFLKQLVVRLERFIFFPGDHIVEIGDVDHNMYFIHKGEVKCVVMDERYPSLEKTVDLLVTGESFGILQGLSFTHPHMNTYRAKVLTDILILNFYKWGDLRMAFPEITKVIYKKSRQAISTTD